MAINTFINLAQNNTDLFDAFKEYFEKQINPLANAGQRFGISANGITYKSFNINDIFNNIYDADKYIAELKYVNSNDVKISIVDKESYNEEDNIYKEDAISQNIYLSGDDDIVSLLSYVINNIEEYQKDSLLINEDGILTCILKGKYVNENENEDGEIFYFQYDIVNNRLIHFINSKPYDGYINEINNWYILYKLDYADNDTYNLSVHLFTLESIAKLIINIFNIDSDENDIKVYLKDIYKYSTSIFESDSEHTSRSFSPFNYVFKDYNLLTAQNTSNVFTDINLFQIVLNYNEEDYNKLFNSQINIIHFDNLIVNYNLENDNEYFTINTSDNTGYKKVIGYLSNEDISDYLSIVLNIHFIYLKLIKYYNKLVYNESASTLYSRIIISLFNEIRKDINIDDYNDRMYIPLDYKIHYVCNDNNLLDIYYSNNIYVTLVNTTEFKSQDIRNMIIYYHPSCVSHSVIYNFEFDYNQTYSDIITALNIVKLYSLPYINKLNNWIINDIDTNINAINDINSGIKTIFLYSNDDDFEILNISNLLNDDNTSILNKFTCDKKSFIVNPKLFTNYSNYHISCSAWIPTITDYNKDFFNQTLIISISSKNNFQYDEYKNDYNLDYVYSLWVMTEVNGKLKFDYIKDLYSNNEYAYDPFNSTAFLQYLTNESSRVNALLVSSQNYKQTSSDVSNNSWLVTRNKNANNYNAIGYNNEYNTIIEYVSQLNKSGDNSSYPSNKFISDLSNIQITNSIYPKIKFDSEIITSTTEFKRLVTNLKSNYHYYEIIIVNGQRITTEETLQEIINQVNVLEVTKQQTPPMLVETARVNSNNTTFYNEYVFNTNVPTLDLKELFVRNVNVLNRTNIISLSPDNKVYNGYIGTSFTSNDKSILHISGSNTNINLGTDTLLNPNQYNKFNAYNTLSLDSFDTININPTNALLLSKNPLIYKSNNEYVTSVVPFGLMNNKKIPFRIYTENNNISFAFSDNYIPSELSINKNILFVRFYLSFFENAEEKKADMFDCLYLNNLIYNICGENINTLSLVNFKKVDNNMIFMIKVNEISHFFMMLNSHELDINDDSLITQSFNHNLIIAKYNVINSSNQQVTTYKISFDDSISNDISKGSYLVTDEHGETVNYNTINNNISQYMINRSSDKSFEVHSYTTDDLTYQNIRVNITNE